jgi:hypothetical protein
MIVISQICDNNKRTIKIKSYKPIVIIYRLKIKQIINKFKWTFQSTKSSFSVKVLLSLLQAEWAKPPCLLNTSRTNFLTINSPPQMHHTSKKNKKSMMTIWSKSPYGYFYYNFRILQDRKNIMQLHLSTIKTPLEL